MIRRKFADEMSLSQVLEKIMNSENESQLNRRKYFVNRLRAIITRWINEMTKMDDAISKINLPKINGFVTPFGSMYMDFHNVDSDIDLICVAPKHISRKLFFTELPLRLETTPGIQYVQVIENAFIPLIKFEFNEVNFDLVFVRLNRLVVPQDLPSICECISDEMDPICLRSINGIRTIIEISKLIKNPTQFAIALRAIKLWAKTKGIHSNLNGYFGGITWVIMLVFVYNRQNRNLCAQELVYEFFNLFAFWDWNIPVDLNPLLSPGNDDVCLYNGTGEQNCMIVLTPTIPKQNSTYNTCLSSRKIIKDELWHGFCCVKEIRDGKANWNLLFEEFSILGRYKHFLAVCIFARNVPELKKIESIVDCRMRMLAAILSVNSRIDRAQIMHHSIDLNPSFLRSPYRMGNARLIGIGISKSYQDKNDEIDISEEINLFSHTLHYMLMEENDDVALNSENYGFSCEYLRIDQLEKVIDIEDAVIDGKMRKQKILMKKIKESVELLMADIVDFVVEVPIRLNVSRGRGGS